ncbi:hypothetical protein FB45DRAFT_1021571 [Roridomyces roridus]|uniref:G-protein coupled receptors family 2 profile 2 domain-containing protein n=1 Tax=Roridomyces roridus TaxID=1738132 RepID=A0AAD7CCU9_9AGAR|nr:hypothetical protein FB45DRAFT_1021571 [Roridomyces roridus]
MSLTSRDLSIDNAQYLNELLIALTVPSISLTVLVLLAFAFTAWHPKSLPCLNRVSFRLLVYALIANLLFGSVWLSDWSPELLPSSEAGCTAVAFLNNIALLFSAAMFFSMALNLQLVLVHGVNGQMMEKYYLIGAALLTSVCSITTLAAGHFGYYEQDNGCWFKGSSPDEQLSWVVGAQAFWVLAMAVGEVIMFVILVGFMCRHQRRNAQILSNVSNASHRSAPILQYRPIILRIGLYPLLSCVLNFSATILDLYLAKHPENTALIKRLDVMDIYIYALRPFFYTCLAATDPSFMRGLQALRKGPSNQSTGTQTSIGGGTTTTSTTATAPRTRRSTVSSGTSSSRHKHFSVGTQALVRIDLERVVGVEGGVARPERVSDESGHASGEMVEVRPEGGQDVDAEGVEVQE